MTVASIGTGQPLRDARLRTELFDAERFPRMRFRAAGPLASPLTGELTIRDVTRAVRFDVSSGCTDDGSLTLHGAARIRRRDFGLDWAALVEAGRVVVSDRVDITVDLVLVPRRTRPAT